MSRGTARYCTRCGQRIARDGRGALCTRCGRTVFEAPRLPAKVWRTPEMRDALSSRDMGRVARAYRHHPIHGRRPLPQSELARWLGITQSQLSRIENGRSLVRDMATHVHYARQLHIPRTVLWFDIDDDEPAVAQTEEAVVRLPGGRAVPAASARIEQPLADSLLSTLEQYATTDMLSGPHSLVPVVEHQIAFIDQLLTGSRGKTRTRLRYVSARYAEFLGWLQQDIGDLRLAMQWSNTALDLAQACRDRHLLSYVQMRKSNIASDQGEPDLAVDLAGHALENSASLTPRLHAVALRQQAHGLALRAAESGSRSDAAACAAALAKARDLAADPGQDPVDLARYCTPGFISMEAARCWVELGLPDKAMDALEQGLVGWHPGGRRDLGLGFARLAVAHAGVGQPDEALEVAGHSLAILAQTGSGRTISQLRRVSDTLVGMGASGHARELDDKLRKHSRRPGFQLDHTDRRIEWT